MLNSSGNDQHVTRWSASTVSAQCPVPSAQAPSKARVLPHRDHAAATDSGPRNSRRPFALLGLPTGALPAGPKDCFDGDNGLQSPAKQARLDALQRADSNAGSQCHIQVPLSSWNSASLSTLKS
ncbi:hypothetical protein CEP52_007593 [Fusarium oligoseptatum]|uniref:Uncharacterized protein n=1 Tax=Fusarium oligoseptatum TaxID=2604345 RepID=A0A428TM53_9HYPO|nr:hypothetical protein CEP52_007593 [Fusarium oligoseptatum]